MAPPLGISPPGARQSALEMPRRSRPWSITPDQSTLEMSRRSPSPLPIHEDGEFEEPSCPLKELPVAKIIGSCPTIQTVNTQGTYTLTRTCTLGNSNPYRQQAVGELSDAVQLMRVHLEKACARLQDEVDTVRTQLGDVREELITLHHGVRDEFEALNDEVADLQQHRVLVDEANSSQAAVANANDCNISSITIDNAAKEMQQHALNQVFLVELDRVSTDLRDEIQRMGDKCIEVVSRRLPDDWRWYDADDAEDVLTGRPSLSRSGGLAYDSPLDTTRRLDSPLDSHSTTRPAAKQQSRRGSVDSSRQQQQHTPVERPVSSCSMSRDQMLTLLPSQAEALLELSERTQMSERTQTPQGKSSMSPVTTSQTGWQFSSNSASRPQPGPPRERPSSARAPVPAVSSIVVLSSHADHCLPWPEIMTRPSSSSSRGMTPEQQRPAMMTSRGVTPEPVQQRPRPQSSTAIGRPQSSTGVFLVVPPSVAPPQRPRSAFAGIRGIPTYGRGDVDRSRGWQW